MKIFVLAVILTVPAATPAMAQGCNTQQVITTDALGADGVYATDLDGDGDADVLSASVFDNKIAWYENLGSGSFGTQQVITTVAVGVDSVYATDLDGDGNRCVGGTQGSVVRMFPFAQADGGGFLHHALDNTLPVHAPVAAGATLNFQAWFRDPLGFTGFNLSDGLSVTFAP